MPAPPANARGLDVEPCLKVFQAELDYIYATLRRLGTPQADIEDLMQEVFLALRHSWAGCDLTRPMRPYLFGIAFRISSAHRRKYRREVKGGTVEAPDSLPGADELLQSHEAHQLLLAALDRIPLRRRAVLVMHDLDEVPVADIASALKLTRFSVYARLRKARRELAAALRRIGRASTPEHRLTARRQAA